MIDTEVVQMKQEDDQSIFQHDQKQNGIVAAKEEDMVIDAKIEGAA